MSATAENRRVAKCLFGIFAARQAHAAGIVPAHSFHQLQLLPSPAFKYLKFNV